MKILLCQEDKRILNLQEVSARLNAICKTLVFNTYSQKLLQKNPSTRINWVKESFELASYLKSIESNYDLIILVTERKYPDNFFYHKQNNIMILSLANWKYYTNLPFENGIVYFVCHALVLDVDNSFRHFEKSGCLYDFLKTKTDVDLGMKVGYICPECMNRLSRIKLTDKMALILIDINRILSALSNASKLETSFLGKYSLIETKLDWRTFEDDVSHLYRTMGAEVKQNVSLAGFQIDILIEEETPSKQKVRSAVECKFYKSNIGNRIVNDFARKVKTLKDNGLVDKGIIVSNAGFTIQAREVAKATGIEIRHYEDIKTTSTPEIIDVSPSEKLKQIIAEKEKEEQDKKGRAPSFFVIMPFSKEFDDVYYLGIAETVRKVGCTCDRVDQIDYVGEIMEKIYDSINNSEVVIAELTQPNTNVYYELGYAHAKNKLTILITKDIAKASFDVKGYNCIIYENIIDLKKKLEKRLLAII